MRIAALALVGALASCNQIWGNDPVVRWDAPLGEGAPLPTARLELLVTTTDASGAATNVPELRPLAPAPTVQIGRIDGPLMAAPYANGVVSIPTDFPGTPWRLVFTDADVPHEVHWAPAVGVEGRAVIPQFGGVDRGVLPANASYRLQPTSAPAQYTDVRVYTTGVWATGMPQTSGSIATQPMTTDAMEVATGTLLAPDPTRGDVVILANYTGTTCLTLTGAAVFRAALTGPDSTQSPAPTYFTGPTTTISVTGDNLGTRIRIADRLGLTTNDFFTHTMYGFGSSTVAPAFVTHPFDAPLWGPVMIPFARCVNADLGVQNSFAVPVMDSAELPRIAHVQMLSQRTLPGGAIVFSGVAGSAVAMAAQSSFGFDLDVGMPATISLGGASISGTTDRVPLTSTSTTLDLTFELDGDADYVTATLYRAGGSSLVRERAYTFTGTTLTIDRSVLAAQTEYVLELRTFTGAPGAVDADFTKYVAQQSSASRFTRTFVTP